MSVYVRLQYNTTPEFLNQNGVMYKNLSFGIQKPRRDVDICGKSYAFNNKTVSIDQDCVDLAKNDWNAHTQLISEQPIYQFIIAVTVLNT